MKTILGLCLIAGYARCQLSPTTCKAGPNGEAICTAAAPVSPAPSKPESQSALPAQIVLVSGSYTDHPGPKFAATGSFAAKLKAPGGCYSYSSEDVQPVVRSGKLTVAQSTRTGGACQVPELSKGNFNLFILGTAGMTVINSSVLGSGSTGILGAWKPAGHWGAWMDFQDSNTTGKTLRVGALFAWN